jgi:hypothetical protein
MAIPGRTWNREGYRYGFGGHENINEVTGEKGTVDMGDRWLNVKLGRTSKPDAKSHLYPYLSPYSYAANTPLNAIDPDGKVVLFINGQHAGGGGTSSYWGGYDKDVMKALGDKNARYIDGALGGWKNTGTQALKGGTIGILRRSFWGALVGAALKVWNSSNVSLKVRIAAGEKQGYKDAKSIIDNLLVSDGETIKIVTHSMGTAFARGYVKGILKYAEENGLKEKVKFEYELDVNSFQGADLPADPNVKQTQYKLGGLDGGNSFKEAIKANSIPTVAPIPGAKDISSESDANKGHAVSEMSLDKIPELGNGGKEKKIEQGSNNEE